MSVDSTLTSAWKFQAIVYVAAMGRRLPRTIQVDEPDRSSAWRALCSKYPDADYMDAVPTSAAFAAGTQTIEDTIKPGLQ